MKVMIISSLYGFSGGGAGLMAHHIARGLAAAGHRVSVVTTSRTGAHSVSEEQDIRIHRFRPLNLYPLEDKDSHPVWQKAIWQLIDIYNLQCARALREILAREAPDIVHIHKMRGFSGAVWQAAAHMVPGRVIQTCHDYESMSPEGLLRGVTGRLASQRKWPLRGYQLMRARLSTGVSAVTAPSAFTLNRIRESGLFPGATQNVIPNTHGWSEDELATFHKESGTHKGGPGRFLFLGRLEIEKGIASLCDAFLRASARNPQMSLEIAGWGTLDRELRSDYARNPNITFLGAIHGKAKEASLCIASAVVVPSLVDEVFGLAAVEAFAFGKPVIASNMGGLPELVKPGETGWLVEPGDVQGLAERLQAVAETDRSSMERISQNCKAYSSEFTVERVINAFSAIYSRVVG